jgi:hypothetical protein
MCFSSISDRILVKHVLIAEWISVAFAAPLNVLRIERGAFTRTCLALMTILASLEVICENCFESCPSRWWFAFSPTSINAPPQFKSLFRNDLEPLHSLSLAPPLGHSKRRPSQLLIEINKKTTRAHLPVRRFVSTVAEELLAADIKFNERR